MEYYHVTQRTDMQVDDDMPSPGVLDAAAADPSTAVSVG
jgi:hypothetical protein